MNLPPLGHDDDYQLVSHDPALERARRRRSERRRTVLDVLERESPRRAAGRAVSLRPQEVRVRAAAAARGGPGAGSAAAARAVQPARHPGPRASRPGRPRRTGGQRANALLRRGARARRPGVRPARGDVHRRARPLRVPVHYTGFVAPPPPRADDRGDRLPQAPRLRRRRHGRRAAVPRGGAALHAASGRADRPEHHRRRRTVPARSPAWQWLRARRPTRRSCTPYAGSTTSAVEMQPLRAVAQPGGLQHDDGPPARRHARRSWCRSARARGRAGRAGPNGSRSSGALRIVPSARARDRTAPRRAGRAGRVPPEPGATSTSPGRPTTARIVAELAGLAPVASPLVGHGGAR